MTTAPDTPALEALKVAAAERDRLKAVPRSATPTMEEQRAHRRRLRAARYAVQAAVVTAYRAGADVTTVAQAAGVSPKHTRQILHAEAITLRPQERPGRRPYSDLPTPPRHAQALEAIAAVVPQPGRTDERTRAAIVQAAAIGVPIVAMARVVGVTAQRVGQILRAART
ncbi:hypothetical protein OG948_21195 [Embleya sp. NBC_00888]|uniref:hypothetical protein n=1 Tax=Embleya sp. NBC_00888 TaxID=2975960 RepID=UPI00386302EA|nr:hypothetical protein OG948_21195 [Embleya sp. NBC_00888]